jgi:muramoyltetrapeptide carboxypeptidase
MEREKTNSCVEILQNWGFKVLVGKSVGNQFHYFSGTDEERLADFQDMLDNPDIKAILCARGGYGTSRIIDQVHWKAFRKNPKWIIGYSDVTVLHCHLFKKFGIASLHAPMAGAFAEGENEYVLSFKKAITGKILSYKTENHPLNRGGEATGPLLGGNLSLLAHLTGTPSMPDLTGAILFIEDVGEYLYNIDRMLLQLDRAGKLKDLSGMIIGGFTDNKDTVTPFGKTAYELIAERLSRYQFPVAFNFPVSHERNIVALRAGMYHTLKVGKDRVTLTGNP